MNKTNKTIVALSDFEHVLKKPTVYVSSIEASDENIPIIRDGKISIEGKSISIGFYKLLNEIIDNAFDEAKRCKGKIDNITVEVFSQSGRVIVTDDGDGFENGTAINETTGKSNIETAVSMLRAGSNFYNEEIEENLIGTNGIGAAVVNMLSDNFSIKTGDGNILYTQSWDKFISGKVLKKKSKIKGTVVDFTPRKDMFVDCVWDEDIIHTSCVFRNYIKNMESLLRNVKFTVKFDGKKLDLNTPFYNAEEALEIKSTKYGKVIIWKSFSNSTSLSFINGQLCTGIHQKIVQDHLNEILKDEKAHDFYDSFIVLDLPPNMVLFKDQNKTRFATNRYRIQPLYDKYFKSKVKSTLIKSNLYNEILQAIKDRASGNANKEIDKLSKTKKKQLSDKYFPATIKQEYLFIVEGESAVGSILQERNPKTMGFYALKGKIKNVKKKSDMTSNAEISDLIRILGLDPSGKTPPKYENVVIATDVDADGGHISALLVNFFFQWFPYIIKQNRLYKFDTPLIVGKNKGKIIRFYNMDDYKKSKLKLTEVKYFKGLGSLSIEDWAYEFKELNLCRIVNDDKEEQSMNIAFGDDSNLRKQLLEKLPNE